MTCTIGTRTQVYTCHSAARDRGGGIVSVCGVTGERWCREDTDARVSAVASGVLHRVCVVQWRAEGGVGRWLAESLASIVGSAQSGLAHCWRARLFRVKVLARMAAWIAFLGSLQVRSSTTCKQFPLPSRRDRSFHLSSPQILTPCSSVTSLELQPHRHRPSLPPARQHREHT